MGKGMAYNSGCGRSWFTCAGTARPDSDIDLVLLTTDPHAFRADTAWLDAIDWTTVGARPAKWQDEDYGLLWSRRLWLDQSGGEVEFGFAPPSWADVTHSIRGLGA